MSQRDDFTLGGVMRQAARLLRQQGVPDAERDVRILAAEALGIQRDRVMLEQQAEMPAEALRRFDRFVDARIAREPVSRIIGRRNFYGRDFKVTPHVLDPRPETEVLVELALANPFEMLLDLGTGSGCIALTLLAERPEAFANATDISPDALDTAEANAACLGVLGRIHFEVSDWFAAVDGTFDLIVSNPPYIDPREIGTLEPEVVNYDPKIALFGTSDGLSAYRVIARNAGSHLAAGGRLLVEIGPTQSAAVMELFLAAGLENVQVHSDLDGRDRVVSARAAV